MCPPSSLRILFSSLTSVTVGALPVMRVYGASIACRCCGVVAGSVMSGMGGAHKFASHKLPLAPRHAPPGKFKQGPAGPLWPSWRGSPEGGPLRKGPSSGVLFAYFSHKGKVSRSRRSETPLRLQ